MSSPGFEIAHQPCNVISDCARQGCQINDSLSCLSFVRTPQAASESLTDTRLIRSTSQILTVLAFACARCHTGVSQNLPPPLMYGETFAVPRPWAVDPAPMCKTLYTLQASQRSSRAACRMAFPSIWYSAQSCILQDPAERRHLLRIWVAPPNGWPLPEAFADRYGSTIIGERGGICVPGYAPRIALEAE